MDIYVQDGLTGCSHLLEIGEAELVKGLHEKYLGSLATPDTKTPPPFDLFWPDGSVFLFDDEDLVSTTGLCSGDLLIAEPTPQETTASPTTPAGPSVWTAATYPIRFGRTALSPCGHRLAHGSAFYSEGLSVTHLATSSTSTVISSGKIQTMALLSDHLAYSLRGSTTLQILDASYDLAYDLQCGSRVRSVAATPDEKHIVVGCEGDLQVFSVATGECVRRMSGEVWEAGISPCGRWIATRLAVYSFGELEEVFRIGAGPRDRSSYCVPAFSPCSNFVAVPGKGNSVAVFAAEANGQLLHTFTSHTDTISSLSFSECSRYVFSSSWDRKVLRWDLASRSVTRLLKHSHPIWACVINPSMDKIVFTDGLGTHIHPLGDGKQEKAVRGRARAAGVRSQGCACS